MLRKFGRIYIPDDRDRQYPIAKRSTRRIFRYWWDNGWWGDQGRTPQCVAYSWVHWLEDGPVPQSGVAPIVKPSVLYKRAQQLDEWPGEDYEGTSVRGGAKALKEWGFISQYRWTNTIDVLISAVLELGPVVVGTNWYADMSYPNRSGVIAATGELVGGHAYVLNGVNRRTFQFRGKQPWGRDWGKDGHFYVSFKDMQRLIEDEYGEACLAMEMQD